MVVAPTKPTAEINIDDLQAPSWVSATFAKREKSAGRPKALLSGALILVTHDRYMLDRVSTVVLGLDGKGNSERFGDYSQWEQWKTKEDTPAELKPPSDGNTAPTNGSSNVTGKRN